MKLIFTSLVALILNTLAATAQYQLQATVPAGLSIPNLVSQHAQRARATEIQSFASQIANEKRTWRIGGVEYSFYDGPVARPGSLAEKIQQEQLVLIDKFDTTNVTALYELILNSSFNTEDDYLAYYDKAS